MASSPNINHHEYVPWNDNQARYDVNSDDMDERSERRNTWTTGITAALSSGMGLKQDNTLSTKEKIFERETTRGIFEDEDSHEQALLKIAKEDPRNASTRVVQKGGIGITLRKDTTSGKRKVYRGDWFHSLVVHTWTYLLSVYVIVYILFWLVFSLLYWPMPLLQSEECNTQSAVHTWFDAYMLSVNVASTIGFGKPMIAPPCDGYSILILMFQLLCSLLIDALFMGVIWTKLSRPSKRKASIFFSDVAVIDKRSGVPQLKVRVADMRRNQLVELHTRFILYEQVIGPDGFDVTSVELYTLGEWDYFMLPIVVTHDIVDSSPMMKFLAAKDRSKFEIVAIVEGIVSTTGLTTQTVESYCGDEILEDCRYLPMIRKSVDARKPIEVDFTLLSKIANNLETDSTS